MFVIVTKVSRWFVGQAAKTSPSHGENRGSIPLRTAFKRIQVVSFFLLFFPFIRKESLEENDCVRYTILHMIQKKGVSSMAVCESCGARVQDGITICPECGRPVVKMKTSLGLKGENGKKPVQQRAFTPTDDYGDIYDGNSIGGSDPVKITKEDVKEYKEQNRKQGGGSGVGKVFGTIFKFIIFAAIVFGIYLFVTKVVLKPAGPETYEEAVTAFQTAVNENDSEKLQALVPNYITANKAMVENMLPYVKEANYTSVKIIKATEWNSAQVDEFNDKIQAQHGKTADAREGATLKLGLRGSMKDTNGVLRQYMEVNIDFIKIKGVWYPDIEQVQTQLFNQE